MRNVAQGLCVWATVLLILATQAHSQSTDTGAGETPSLADTAPRIIYSRDPEYSQEARKAGLQGVCVLNLIVGPDGQPRDIRVARTLGQGLDQKAIEAVSDWRFEPATKDGKPVAVQINVEVTFRWYPVNKKLQQLWTKANAGDAKAELEVSKLCFEGRDVPKDEHKGLEFLRKAAQQGVPRAQFLMGDQLLRDNPTSDYVTAYMWYALAERSGYKQSKKILKQLTVKMSSAQISEAQGRVQNWAGTPAK